jgi:hypothetical protein
MTKLISSFLERLVYEEGIKPPWLSTKKPAAVNQ